MSILCQWHRIRNIPANIVLMYPNKPDSIEDQNAEKQGTRIPDSFQRIFQLMTKDRTGETANESKTNDIIMKVTTRPNPFFTSVTLDVSCDYNKHIIVRMFDEAGRIIKMLSWYVMKGSNVTSINELNILNSGQYFLDIIDNEGTVLFNTVLNKE